MEIVSKRYYYIYKNYVGIIYIYIFKYKIN